MCHGDKVVKSLDDLVLFIEKGIPDGHEYVTYIHLPIRYRDTKMLLMSM